jgi:thioredoxin reductase
MPTDTPTTIAVLGAGPIGLEAALYARFLGYSVRVYERGRVGENLERFAHVRWFSPFAMNSSPLGLSALEAQNPAWRPPPPDALLTAGQLVSAYLRPLAESDLLADSVREKTTVVAVGRDGPLKGDLIGRSSRGLLPFRLLLRDDSGAECVETAHVVIDATGTYGNPNWLGHGGIPAVGEMAARPRIEYGLPDVLGAQRASYANRRVLVIGAGYSAATNVIALAELAAAEPQTHITWVTRQQSTGTGPIPLIADDRLPERDRIARQANALAAGESPHVTHWPGTTVDAVFAKGDRFAVRLVGEHQGEIEVDCVIANVGFRPDASIYAELQVHECYATGGPMKLAATLLGSTADCLDQSSAGPQVLTSPEPNFYILGAKSFGRNSKFLVRLGLEQVRDVFRLIGGREGLDLYATVRPRDLTEGVGSLFRAVGTTQE